jgi:hypothetical protein
MTLKRDQQSAGAECESWNKKKARLDIDVDGNKTKKKQHKKDGVADAHRNM